MLGNQRARQKTVAKNDDAQANFYKLMNNSNFGYDCRDHSQNRSIPLIYDEKPQVEFITKYDSSKENNVFLTEDYFLKKCGEKYDNMSCDVINPDDDYSNKKVCIEEDYHREVEDIKEKFRKRVKREKDKLTTFEERIDKVYQDCTFTNVQDLKCTNSVKEIACEKQTTVKVSTGVLSTKLLINAKISLASFIYDCIVTFRTP